MTKKTFSILIILIAGLALGGCAYNPFLKQQPSDQGQTPQQGNGEEPSIKEESKLYAHPSGEYFFRYPSDWQAVDVNEQGENYIVTTRLSGVALLIEIGEFKKESGITKDNIFWKLPYVQTWYEFSNLISREWRHINGSDYLELQFKDEAGTAHMFLATSRDDFIFFVNVKEGLNNFLENVEKVVGTLSFDKQSVPKYMSSFCPKRETVLKLTVNRKNLKDEETQLIIKIFDKNTRKPISDASVHLSKPYSDLGKTDQDGVYKVDLIKIPPNILDVNPFSGKPEYFSIDVNVSSSFFSLSINDVNLVLNAIVELEVYLDTQKKSQLAVLNNPLIARTFFITECNNDESGDKNIILQKSDIVVDYSTISHEVKEVKKLGYKYYAFTEDGAGQLIFDTHALGDKTRINLIKAFPDGTWLAEVYTIVDDRSVNDWDREVKFELWRLPLAEINKKEVLLTFQGMLDEFYLSMTNVYMSKDGRFIYYKGVKESTVPDRKMFVLYQFDVQQMLNEQIVEWQSKKAIVHYEMIGESQDGELIIEGYGKDGSCGIDSINKVDIDAHTFINVNEYKYCDF